MNSNNRVASMIRIYWQLCISSSPSGTILHGNRMGNYNQDHHIASKTTIKRHAEDWGTKLLKINWKYILELWDIRNDEVKGSNLEEQNSNLRRDMMDEIIYLQQQNPDLPFEMQLFLNIDREALEAKATIALISYLYGVKLLIHTHRRKLTLARKIIHRHNRSRHPPHIHQNPHDKIELDPGE
jgi:hypothetical protein